MKKTILFLFVLIMLNGLIPATGGADKGQAKPDRGNQDVNLLKTDVSLLKELEAKVNAKVKEYRDGNFSENQIAQQQIKIHDEYTLEKKKNETEFNREYDRLQNYLYRLGVIKLNLYNIQEEIKSR
ncbi:MAG: hypothetical protein MUF15_16750, partial [Acidobacteria bacterium]|nr:hypothetical protein [Acidobacteriota bacterium]